MPIIVLSLSQGTRLYLHESHTNKEDKNKSARVALVAYCSLTDTSAERGKT